MSSNASKTSTTRKVRTPGHIRQGINPEAKAKLAEFAVEHRLANLVKRDATHYLQRQRCQDWVRAVEAATLPLGPALLPKTRKNIAAWQALTPAQQADRKAKAIAKAREEAAAAKADRKAKKQEA